MASASVVLTSDTSGSVTVTVPSGTAIGTTTLTLPTSGGTIQTSGSGYTTNGVAYASSTSALTTGTGLKFDGANLGINVTPSAWDSTWKALDIDTRTAIVSAGNKTSCFTNNAYFNGGWKYKDSSFASVYSLSTTTGQHEWNIAPAGTAGNAITLTQAMTLDNSGNLLVGATANGQPDANYFMARNASGFQANIGHATGTASGQPFVYMVYGGGAIGSITQNGTTAVAYNTSSDYRLKNTIAPMIGALAKVALLKPVTYKWNADGSDAEGFIAHELAEVCPHAVTGEKDAVDENGNPKYQGIDTSFLVATLTSAIQELSTLITAQQSTIQSLTERITALEGART